MPFLAIVDCRFFLDPLENLDINLVGVYIRFRCADMGIDFDTRVAESQSRRVANSPNFKYTVEKFGFRFI